MNFELLIKNGRVIDPANGVDEKCDACAGKEGPVCAQICPVVNIKMENGKPCWLHHCEHCLACLHWCPQEAIQFGKNTKGRKRYRHPEITSAELIKIKDQPA